MAATISSVMSQDSPWSNLPQEVIEIVLCFLPVPVLCRFRTVCKGWDDLLCRPTFHDLYEQNRKQQHREVCFLTRFEVRANKFGWVSKLIHFPTKGTTCFLELDERRWYLIKGFKDIGFDTRAVAMDDGLVAEFWAEDADEAWEGERPAVSCIQMWDPISKMKWSVDPPFDVCPWDLNHLALMVAGDRSSRSFRIFLIDNSVIFNILRPEQFLWVFESDTDKWQGASHPPNLKWEGVSNPPMTPEKNKITRASSVVFFRGDLYAILSPYGSEVCFLMRYDCQKDSWSMILQDLPDLSAHSRLLVSSGRLYMCFWRSASSTSNARTMLEMVEIQIPENASRTVFQIPSARLEHFFEYRICNFTCVFPRLSSDGSCSSVVLVSASTGRVVNYNVVSGSGDILPAHPFSGVKPEQSNYPSRAKPGIGLHYWATHKNLCFRDVLRKKPQSHAPVYVPEHQLK